MTSTADTRLDLGRLEKLRESAGKLIARCPACAEHGGDRAGNHLVILPDGRFGCAAHSGDPEHRRRIFSLAGVQTHQTRDPQQDREWRERREREARRERKRRAVADSITSKRAEILDRFAWDPADVWDSSPVRIEGDAVDDPADFLSALFPGDSIVWTGEVWQSGPRHSDRWRSVDEWAFANPGPMITPCTWRPGTVSRTRENVESDPYVVLDFDGAPGWSPRDARDLEEHLARAFAIVRWLREGLNWRLAAILFTGGKSAHSWFRTPGEAAIESLRAAAPALGIDAGLIGHPEHPARLPGQRHQKTRCLSRVLWLATNPNPSTTH